MLLFAYPRPALFSSQRLRQLREVDRQPPRWPPFGDHELDIDDGIGWSLRARPTKLDVMSAVATLIIIAPLIAAQFDWNATIGRTSR
jgi:hypothetical protein